MKLPQPIRRYGLRAAAGGAIAAGFTAMAVLPSAASPDFQAAFKRLDANGDGVLTAEEFAGPKTDDDDKNVVVETRSITRNNTGNAPPPRAATGTRELKQEAFSFYLPEGVASDGSEQQHEYKFVSQHATVVKSDASGTPQPPMTISLEDIRKREFEAFDGDKDGKVSLAEYQARQRAMLTRGFEILDANNDKSLSADEYVKIISPPMIKLHPGDPDTPTPPEINITSGGPKISVDALRAAFTKLDANKDRKLTLQEYLPPT